MYGSMKSCAACKSELEDYVLYCPNCGKAGLDSDAPIISDIAPSKEELSESYRTWMERGQQCLESRNYEEACNALREAVKRSRVLEQAQTKEIEARKALADALEKLGKTPEAADQYRIMAQECSDSALAEHWLKKSQDLLASSTLAFDELFKKEAFRRLLDEEIRYVPLYCSGCKRLLAEAEVYGFRRGRGENVRCWCGIEDRPLAKEGQLHQTALSQGQVLSSSQRARAIQVAGKELADGKRRSTACMLALFGGWCGAHKFYLGESVAGWIYLFWFWTLVPFFLSIYEALILSQMNIVTFNMTYNLDQVLALTLPEDTSIQSNKMELFSLETAEEEQENNENQEVLKNGSGGKEV
ncbi:MAG: NINE protein [Candidatus Obscuribacterales bacterium]|nr:NINE protein [Candidatus Obscuribacterales bacterium]